MNSFIIVFFVAGIVFSLLLIASGIIPPVQLWFRKRKADKELQRAIAEQEREAVMAKMRGITRDQTQFVQAYRRADPNATEEHHFEDGTRLGNPTDTQ